MATLPRNRVMCCDCREGMEALPDRCIDLTVTSPPYSNMRTYGGHRYDFDTFREIARGLARVTKDGGVICWVVANQIENMRESLQVEREKLYFVDDCGLWPFQHIVVTGQGDLPWGERYASNMTHHVCVLSKGRPSYIHCLKDRINRTAGQPCGKRRYHNRDGSIRVVDPPNPVPPLGRRTNVWYYKKGNDGLEHPAMMNPRLARDLIRSYSRPGELVFDTMAGSGVSLAQAILTNRDFLGFEIHQPYVDICRRRIEDAQKSRVAHIIQEMRQTPTDRCLESSEQSLDR